jgi:hypothetical protein
MGAHLMQNIPIQAIPNQQFSTVIDNNRWDISLKTTNGTVSCTLLRNGETIVDNARCVSGMRIIPCIYQENGNFAFVSQLQELPDYNKFGVTQFMIYLSPDELAVIRTPPPAIITSDFFDPLAALPLRFAPQGYVQAAP